MNNEKWFQLVQHYQEQIPSNVHKYIIQTYADGQESLRRHHASVWETSSRTEIFLMVFSILLWCVMMFLVSLGYIVARTRYRSSKRSNSSQLSASQVPGVSIIRPLKGVDVNLLENLASSFRQDYPKFEIIFSVASENDPAVKVVKKLMKKFPNADVNLIIGQREVGVNPKINNLIRAYESVKYDIIWILDSNVYVDPGCLGRSVDKLIQPGVGLVHHLPFAIRPETFGSELEMMFMDTVHAKMYLAINAIGPDSCVVGKSNLYRKSDLESVGGLAQFGKYMAEDNLIARALWRKGFKHEMTSDLAYQPLGSMATADYFLRRSRWTRIRKYTVTAATVVEPFTESILCGLCASFGFNLLWNIHPLNFLAFHLILWFWLDLKLFQSLNKTTLNMESLRGFIMAWAMREITALPLYIYSVLGNNVDWRDGTFRLMRDSTVERIPSPHQHRSTGSLSLPSLARNIAAITNYNTTHSTSNIQRNAFYQRQFVVSILTSIILVIDIIMDILFSSNRNGNPVENLEADELRDSGKEKVRKRRSGRKSIGDAESDPMMDIDSSDELHISNQDDPIIQAAGQYLKNTLSRTSQCFEELYHEESDETNDSDIDNNNLKSNEEALSATSRNNCPSPSTGDKEVITDTRRPSILNEIYRSVSIGLSMHLQNEKNIIEGQKLRRRQSVSVSSSSNTSKISERSRKNGRSMSLDNI
ncbi:7872_t:CDS:2 [Acaulospora morrowiae]|uniref:Ceramide glucosyltransferase n=1 Tax=Acaulospora morrowiae TaxID=94023 RepID=A0A9N9G7L9_9GLOM|nr:7872_t:CDS:2 [Acaulospora morrowiae]